MHRLIVLYGTMQKSMHSFRSYLWTYYLWGIKIKYKNFFPNSTFITYVLVRVFILAAPAKINRFFPARHFFFIAYVQAPFVERGARRVFLYARRVWCAALFFASWNYAGLLRPAFLFLYGEKTTPIINIVFIVHTQLPNQTI